MNLSVSGHQIEVTPAIRDYVSDKIARIERQIIDRKPTNGTR